MEKEFDFLETFKGISDSLFLGGASLNEKVFELILIILLILYLLFVVAIWRQVRLMSTTLETELAPLISKAALFYMGLILLTLGLFLLLF